MILSYIIYAFYLLLMIYEGIIFIDVILSWVPNCRQYKIPSLIHTVANWFMEPFHNILTIGYFDFSPILGFAIINGITIFCFNL